MNRIKSVPQQFWVAFNTKRLSEDEEHALYQTYRPWAESLRITIQMLIGCVLGIAVLIDSIVFLYSSLGGSPAQSIVQFNPLDIIAYGLFFSTGVDLAYMLFTPGPDEAIDPVMTGLAATILLGVGKIDYKHLQLEYGIILFLAIAGLAGLFATRKFLFHPSNKNKVNKKN